VPVSHPRPPFIAWSVEKAFALATDSFGPVEILINCAGVAPTAPFHRMEFADWQKTLDVNLNGVFHCTQVALGDMKSASWGRIVTIASTASLRGFAYVSGYCASKHAALGLTRALALETAQLGITVNAVCPSYVDTDIVREAIQEIMTKTGRSEAEALQHFTQSSPQGRLVEASEVAASVSWLCSGSAASVTGQAIAIDGGSTASSPQGRLVEASEVAASVSWLCSGSAASVTGQAIAIDGGSTA